METAIQGTQERRTRRRKRGQRGSICRRPGSQTWTIIYRTPDGRQKWEGGFAVKDDATSRLTEVLGSINGNRYVERDNTSFRDFCDKWMNDNQPKVKPKTWASWESALTNWITPKFGDWPISDISRAAVKSFAGELLAHKREKTNNELSVKFIKNVLSLLHLIFEHAIDEGKLAFNPATRAVHVLPKKKPVEVAMPTPEDVVKTIAELPAVYQVLLATAAVTGFRRAELLALQWSDVDLLNGSISVRRTLQRITKELLDNGKFRDVERIGDSCLAFVPPKSGKAERTVEITPKIMTLLASLKTREQQSSPESQFVFQTDIGAPIDPDSVYDVLHAAQDKAEVPHFGLHGARHLYASLLVESNADVKFAQEKLGHASAMVTLDVYARTRKISKRGQEFAAAVEAAFPFSVSNLLAERAESSQAQNPVN